MLPEVVAAIRAAAVTASRKANPLKIA